MFAVLRNFSIALTIILLAGCNAPVFQLLAPSDPCGQHFEQPVYLTHCRAEQALTASFNQLNADAQATDPSDYEAIKALQKRQSNLSKIKSDYRLAASVITTDPNQAEAQLMLIIKALEAISEQ